MDMVHYQLGVLPFENNCGRIPTKRKIEEENLDEGGPTLKKMKYTPYGDMPDNNFPPDEVLLQEGWDDVLLERLQPAIKSANHKRVAATDDFNLISLPRLQPSTTTAGSIETPIHLERRATSEELSLEACIGLKRHHYLNEAVYLSAKHDDPEMSRRSPRNSRKRANISTKESVVDLSSDTEQPLPPQDEGTESAGLIENDSIVLFSKRLRPNSGRKLQEPSDTADIPNSTKSISTGNAHTLRSGQGIDGGEGKNASVEGNERDQNESNESKAPIKEKWSYFAGYKTRKPSSVRDFVNPPAVAPVPPSSRGHKSMPIPKGPAPVNRLSSNNLTQASPHTQPSKIGNNASSSNPPFKQPLQKFNFHEEHSRRGEQPPRKRQRVDGTPTSHNGSSKSPIDLEAGSANSNRQMGPPASKSGSSQGMKGPQYQGVEEYHRVEDTVGFSKRKNNPPDRQISNGNGSKRFLPKAKNERWVGRLDDDNDPISEDDLAVTGSRHINKATSQLARKSNLEVQIPTPRQAEGTTGYQGTSHKQPSRPKEKMWGNGDARQTPEEEKGEKFSRFFPNAQNPQQRKNSTGSHSADDTAPSRTSARLSDQQNGTPSTKKAPTDNSSPPLNPNVSIDELNADEFYQHTAGTLLAKQKTARAGESKSKGADKRSQSITLDESSDDDLSNDKANMITTDFIPSSKAKPKKRPGEVTFDVLQVFSKSYKWLLASSLKRWTLLENCKEGTFTIFDEHGEAVPDLVLAPQSISKIVRGKDNSKLVLHKSMDQTAKRSPQICLELSDEAECDFFAERLKKAYPNIGNTSEPGEYVDKIFDTALRQPKSTMQASSSRKDPDDLILAQKKSEARHAAEWNRVQDKKKASTNSNRIIDQLQADSEPDRSERNTRSTRSQLSLHHSDDDEPSPSFKNYEVTPDAFYGGPSTRRRSGSSVYEILPSTRATEREPRTRQLRPRAPSPPPLRSWTRDNPNWTRNWHSSIIYPAVGKDRARVDMGDIEKLDEGEFLNDNLIVFYLRWLQDQLEQQHPEWAKRIYFQNTFFYQKLSNPEKGMKGINYEAVKKWTSKVDLLSKDYIIIPINEHSHWYVAVICNAPKLLPGGETTDHSQSQGTNELPEDEGTNAEDGPKASLAPIAPPKPTPDTASGGDVDVVMRDMSLEEKIPGGTEELPSDSNSVLDEQDVAENDNPPPANVTSDLLESGTAKASQTKKSKRKSLPPQRKYNPKEFRIITLDSLGSSHTGTCSNLKDYLVLEIKDKKDIEIPRPGSIGTTAKGIPTQNNYYDCGLFLLSYVEMFLQNPDGFISGILQNDLKENIQWPKAPEMRARIRDLLFNLQKYQLAEAERLGKLKGKGKKTSKTEDKSGSASTSKLSSREASKSARASPDKPVVGELQDIQEKIVKSKAEPPTKEMPPKSRQSVSAEPAMAFEPEKSGILSRPASPVKIDVHKPGKPTQRDVGNVDTPSKRVAKGSGGMLNRLLSGTHKYMTGLLNNEKPATLNASNSKSPKPDIIEIKESPKKVDSGMQDSSRTIAEESPEILESGHSNVERNKQATSRTRRQHDAQSSRQGLPKYNRHDLTSPTPDAMDAPRPVPARREVQDLRSPSPPVRNRSTTAQEQWTVALKKRNLLPSADRERSVKAPSPEVMQTPSHVELDHRSAQYTENGSGNSREATDDEFKRFVHEEVADSEDEDTDDDAVDFVKMHTRSNGLSKPEDLASDEEMLMQPSNSQEEAVEDADSSLLSAPVVSSPPSGSASNKHREGQKSAPSSPVSRYENSRRGAATSPARGTKRKNPGTGESDNWQDHRRPSPVERDALDQAMIGEHVARGAQGGRHTRFLS